MLATGALAVPSPLAAQAATGSLVVEVDDALGRPVSGAHVALDGPATPSGRTGAAGAAVLFHVRPGLHVVRVTADDGGQAAGAALVAPGAATRIHLVAGPPSVEPAVPPGPTRPAEGHVFQGEALHDRPRPGDPWSFLRDVPGVVLDRVDVGGSETARQSVVVSRGDPGNGTTWTLDGADVTDPAALGSSALYADTDALGALTVRLSPLDARVRTPGVQVGLFTPGPASSFSGALHARATGLQGDNLPPELSGRPFPRASTLRGLDFGARAGGPLVKGRAWAWGAAGLDQLRQATPSDHDETLRLSWLSARGVVRLRGGHTSLLALRSEKVHEDRDTTFTAEPDARWRQSGPTTLVAVEDVRRIGAVSLLTRAAWLDAGFRLQAGGGESANVHEDARGIFRGSYQTFETGRPRLQAGAEIGLSGRRFGFDHRAEAGAGYRRSTVETRAEWPGNQVLAFERQTIFFRTFQLTGFAVPTRGQSARSVTEQAEVWIQDEARRGRLALKVGLRLDHAAGRNLASRVEANPVFPEFLPAVAYAGGPTSIRWRDVLPRAGAALDLTRSGSLVVRAGYGAYAAPLGAGDVTFDNPIGREGASVTYYWVDRNRDHVVQRDEIDRARGRVGSSGFVPDAAGQARSAHLIQPGLRAPRTHETFVALEGRGRPRLSWGLHLSWRRVVDPLWRPLRGLVLGDYVASGGVRGELLSQPYDVVYFTPASTSRIVPGNGRMLANRRGYRQDAWNAETTLGGRLGGLEWSASGTLSDWRESFTDLALAVQDPTPTDTEPLRDGGRVAVRASGLSQDVFVNARWTAGVTVAAPLPGGVRGAVRAWARDGFPIPYVHVASTGDPTAGSKSVLVAPQLDTYRLPAVVLVDLRLGRDFRVPGGRVTASVDAFNATGAATRLQVARDVELPAFGRTRDLVRPRIFRFSLEYRFGGPRRVQ